MSNNYTLLNYFQHIYIINLPSRQDRREEIAEQFNRLGIHIEEKPQIEFLNAIRPDNAGEFESIGARGCFLSHLCALKDAHDKGYDRFLVLEDDNNFSDNFQIKFNQAVQSLNTKDWHIFMGNFRERHHKVEITSNDTVTLLPKNTHVELTNFMAFQSTVLPDLIAHLEAMLNRRNGDPKGGPMHMDGAYCWFNDCHEQYHTYVSNNEISYQRSSKSDIYSSTWDKIKSPLNNLFVKAISA